MPKTLLKMAIFVELTIMLICIVVGNLWSSCEVHQYTSHPSNWHPNWHQRGVSGWASRISNLPDHFYCPPGGNCFHCSYHSGFQQEYCCHGSGKWKLVSSMTSSTSNFSCDFLKIFLEAITRKVAEINQEQKRSEKLLEKLLPRNVAIALKNNEVRRRYFCIAPPVK